MAISGQIAINVGAQNEALNSDSLFVAFNKVEENFSTLFQNSSPYNSFVGNTGISTSTSASNGVVTITNTGVVNILAGTGIGVSDANGNVVISVIGSANGDIVAGVTRVGVLSNTLIVTNSPIVSSGNIQVELANVETLTPGEYIAPTFTVDQYGRITAIASTNSAGTVTSVAIDNGTGIGVTGGPITTDGTFTITNTGVTKLNQGPGILLTAGTGEITISSSVGQGLGTVSRVTVDSSSLTVTNSTITTAGTIDIELPIDMTVVGNITTGRNITTTGNITANANISVLGNLNSTVSKVRITGGTNGYVLQTDGTGNLSWTEQTGGSGIAAAAGANTQVQFNNSGVFGANSGFTFNKTTGALSATLFVGSGANLTNIPAANIIGTLPTASNALTSNFANFAGNVVSSAQGNITSLGILTILSVTGNINTSGNLSVGGNIDTLGYIKAVTAANGVSNTQVATTQFVANAISTRAPLANPTFTGTPTAPTANPATVLPSDQIATLSYVASQVATITPPGIIAMWSGSVGSIPTGWTLCDGTLTTPDLRSRFIVGAGGTYGVGQTGGSADAIVVSHIHTANSTSTVTDPGHFHGVPRASSGGGAGFQTGPLVNEVNNSRSSTTGIGVATSTTISSAGSSGTNANLPPYYALCFIMKI